MYWKKAIASGKKYVFEKSNSFRRKIYVRKKAIALGENTY